MAHATTRKVRKDPEETALRVIVGDKRYPPLMPCPGKRARLLPQRGRAVVPRRLAFAIRHKDRAGADGQPVRLKIGPGAGVTGVPVVRGKGAAQAALHLCETAHKGRLVPRRMRGFRTAESLRAAVPGGKKAGVIIARAALRASGSLNPRTARCVVEGMGRQHCRALRHTEGCPYATRSKKGGASPSCRKAGVCALRA